MADFAGQLTTFPGRLDPENRPADLTSLTEYGGTLSLSLTSDPRGGNRGVPQPAVSISHRNVAGQLQEVFGGRLFERIIILPNQLALGFVLTATQSPVEVWNTFRNSDQTLEAINITGEGGLTLTDPYGEPLIFAALDSRIYQMTVPTTGAAQIDQDITFVFLSGIDPVIHITGSRITLFSVAPEWGEGMVESIEYLTDVLKAYSDNEQRRGLRALPRRAMKYRALTLNARNAAGMESLVWGWQNQPYGVPWWPDANPLTSDITAGTFVIPVETADRQFAEGGLLCIWVDEFTFEALSIETVAADSITVTSPTQFSWTAGPGTLVMPVFLARIPASVKIARHSSEIDQLDLDFIGEAQQAAPAPSISLTQYKGFDVLEIPPNWESAPLGRTYARSMVTIDPKVGPITVVDKGGTAIVDQEFPWWLDGHSTITTFRAFILARFGQLNPFWLPTWDQDLVLQNDVGSGDSGIVIKSVFYTRFFFPAPSRRFIAFIPIDGSSIVYRKITGATDNGDGTENLVLDSSTGKAFSKTATMVSFLTFARLGADKTEIKWSTADHADAVLQLQEVPREVPS